MGLLRIAAVLCVIYLERVWSLKCYSCFSYVNRTDCENRYNLKEIECDSRQDTCVRFSMTVKIRERYGDQTVLKTNKAFARYCGIDAECRSGIPSICKSMFHRDDATVSDCVVQCCDPNLAANCHKRPGWPGTQKSSAIITHNDIEDKRIFKGARGTGARLTTTIWSLLPVCLLALV